MAAGTSTVAARPRRALPSRELVLAAALPTVISMDLDPPVTGLVLQRRGFARRVLRGHGAVPGSCRVRPAPRSLRQRSRRLGDGPGPDHPPGCGDRRGQGRRRWPTSPPVTCWSCWTPTTASGAATGNAVIYRVLRELGSFGEQAPATLRELSTGGQRTPEELIDRYQIGLPAGPRPAGGLPARTSARTGLHQPGVARASTSASCSGPTSSSTTPASPPST